jgi:hypothetical protein
MRLLNIHWGISIPIPIVLLSIRAFTNIKIEETLTGGRIASIYQRL